MIVRMSNSLPLSLHIIYTVQIYYSIYIYSLYLADKLYCCVPLPKPFCLTSTVAIFAGTQDLLVLNVPDMPAGTRPAWQKLLGYAGSCNSAQVVVPLLPACDGKLGSYKIRGFAQHLEAGRFFS